MSGRRGHDHQASDQLDRFVPEAFACGTGSQDHELGRFRPHDLQAAEPVAGPTAPQNATMPHGFEKQIEKFMWRLGDLPTAHVSAFPTCVRTLGPVPS